MGVMLRLHLQLFLVLFVSSALWSRARSQGPGDCISNVTVVQNFQTAFAPPGTVCFQCDYGSGVANDSVFQVDNTDVDGSYSQGTTVMGVLVIFNSEQVFDTAVPITVRCDSGGSSFSAITFLEILRPPVITGNTTVNEGGTLILDCDISNSQPSPTVAWFSPQGEMLVGQRGLEIQDIMRSQAGEYKCVATETESGDTSNSTVDVTVQYVPDVTADRTDMIDAPLGSTLVLSCSYQGVPPPNMTSWRNNETELLPSDSGITIVFDDTSTTLTRTNLPADGGGSYTCTASNVVGSGEATTTVRVQLAPGPPTELMVTERTIQSLLIQWQNPAFNGFSPIASFRVSFQNERNSDTNEETFSGDASTTRYNITGLSPYTNYSIELYVRNAVNLEGEAGTVRGITVSLRLSAVNEFTVTAPSSTEIRVQWMDPTPTPTTTAPVERYELTYRETSGGENMTQEISPAASYDVTLTGLRKGTGYNVTITPFNSAGDGEVSTGGVETLVDPPTPPRDFMVTAADPFTLDLSWREPGDSGGRPIDSYLIEYREAGGGASFTPTAVLGADARSYRIECLMPNATYQVAITVNNTNGLDSPNVTEEVTMPQGDPTSTPDAPTVSDITNVSAAVAWTPTDGCPDFYILQYKERRFDWSNENTTTTRNLSSSVLSQPLTDLEPLTSYDVRLQSQNRYGISAFSSEETFSTVGEIMIDGPAQNETQPSGGTITLTCSLEGAGQGTDYEWTRESGLDLPSGSQETGGMLVLSDAQEEDSDVYICTAQGVTGRFNVMIESPTEEPTESDGGVSTTVIIIAAVVGGVALVTFLVVVGLAIFCICFCKKDDSGVRKRTYSFKPKHWTDASGSHTGSRAHDKREEYTQSFHLPTDYQGATSFNTADTVRHSPSPPTYNGVNDNTTL